MNIGIFDTEHFETTYTLISLFDVPGNSITVYTTQRCMQHLQQFPNFDVARYTWHLQLEKESNRTFVARYNKQIKIEQPDLLFYNTISNNHLLHALYMQSGPALRTVLTIHDINGMFQTGFSLRMKKLAQNAGKRLLLKSVREFNVISETMLPSLHKKMTDGKLVHQVPGSFFIPPPELLQLKERMRIVVPGTIDRKRRNYLEALEFLVHAEANEWRVDLVFLGMPYGDYGKEILNIRNKLNLKHSSLKTYNDEVPQEEFDNELRRAHFIFLPSVKISQEPGSAEEIYGTTKATGGMWDAIRHARPMIIPSWLQVPSNVERSVMRYRDIPDLLSLVGGLFEQPSVYIKWQENALDAAQHYTIENIRAANPSLFAPGYSR